MSRTRKPRTHYATRGVLSAPGATAAEAKANLASMIDWALAGHRPFVEYRFGCVLVAAPVPTGWQTTVVFPDGQKHGSSPYTAWEGQIDREKVITSLRMHACTATWTHETADYAHAAASGLDEAGQREAVRYFTWQRDYRAARQAGQSDEQARQTASG